MDNEIRQRFTILTWAVGILAALQIAMLGVVINLSYQVGQVTGELAVVINHIQLK
jgi:hypothetical protein